MPKNKTDYHAAADAAQRLIPEDFHRQLLTDGYTVTRLGQVNFARQVWACIEEGTMRLNEIIPSGSPAHASGSCHGIDMCRAETAAQCLVTGDYGRQLTMHGELTTLTADGTFRRDVSNILDRALQRMSVRGWSYPPLRDGYEDAERAIREMFEEKGVIYWRTVDEFIREWRSNNCEAGLYGKADWLLWYEDQRIYLDRV